MSKWFKKYPNFVRCALGSLAATVIAETIVTLHPHFEIEKLFAFHAAFGFLSCVLMVLVAKYLGLWIKRPEDYYDNQ